MTDNKPRDTCACWKEKKVMSKYCLGCGKEINWLRGRLSSVVDKHIIEEVKIKIQEFLEFHWQLFPKTKTIKMREKRAWLSK